MRSIDEVIEELKYSGYEGGGWMLVSESTLEEVIAYLERYRDLSNRPRSERLMDVLREVRGEK